jgi:acetoin utilization protein AcuB
MQLAFDMLMPPVSRYMTSNPHAVAPCDRLSSARDLMSACEIRHLPVLDNHELVGIVTDRDLIAVRRPEDNVADAMSRHVATVSHEAPIDEVIAMMEAERLGSVVIVGKAGVEGIFTLTDVMRAFCDVLRRTEDGER